MEAGNAKEAVKEVGATTRTIYMVPIDNITVAPGFNLRVTESEEYQEGIRELKDSILFKGFYSTKPLAGFVAKTSEGGNVIYVTDGHRRLEAARAAVAEGADLDKLPMILKPASTSGEDLSVSLHRENMGVGLTMMEKAVLVRRLKNSGMVAKDIAKELGMTDRYVSDLETLIDAPKAVRQLVSSGKISGTEAVKQLRKDPDNAAEKLQTVAAKAAARGQKKATGRDTTHPDRDPGVKMQTSTIRYALGKGQTAPWAEVEAFASLMGDTDWYETTDREDVIEAAEDFEIVVKIRRPKKAEAQAEAEVAEPEEAPVAAKRGRRKKADEPVGVEVDPQDMGELEGTEEGENEDGINAADLRDLGIADPAADL